MSAGNQYPMNQYAPGYLQGVQQPPPALTGREDRPYDIPYEPPNDGVIPAGALLVDFVGIDTDADVYVAGYYIAIAEGQFEFQLTDSQGYQLTKGFVNSNGVAVAASDPTLLSPAHPFPAGGKILIEIRDLSGLDNKVQLVFKAWKRFRVKVGPQQ